MSNKELPKGFIGNDPVFDLFDYGLPEDFAVLKVEKITTDKLLKADKILLEAYKQVDPQGFSTKFEGKPCYRLFLQFDEDVEDYSVRGYMTSKNEVVMSLVRDWLEKEDYVISVGSARKLTLFPWERPKVTSRIPITREMFTKVMEKTKK